MDILKLRNKVNTLFTLVKVQISTLKFRSALEMFVQLYNSKKSETKSVNPALLGQIGIREILQDLTTPLPSCPEFSAFLLAWFRIKFALTVLRE